MNGLVHFVCPFCNAKFSDPRAASWIGRKVRCSKCGKLFVLDEVEHPADTPITTSRTPAMESPVQGNTGPLTETVGLDAGARDLATETKGVQDQLERGGPSTSLVVYTCPFCMTESHDARAANGLGRKITCSKCHQEFVLRELNPAVKAAQPELEPPSAQATGRALSDYFSRKWGLRAAIIVTAVCSAVVVPLVARNVGLRGRYTSSAIGTVRAYLEAPSWRDRASYVLNPAKVQPLMVVHYGSGQWSPPKFKLVTASEPRPDDAGWVTVEADLDGMVTEYYLKRTTDGYRIDWEASAGVNPGMSVTEFHATKPQTPTRFRARAKLDTGYYEPFGNAENDMWSVSLRSHGEDIGNGYVDKTSAAGSKIFEALRDGTYHRVVVDIQHLPNTTNKRCFLISEVVRVDSWWLDEREQAAQPEAIDIARAAPESHAKQLQEQRTLEDSPSLQLLEMLRAAARQQQQQRQQPQPQTPGRVMVRCNACREPMALGASKCPHCGTGIGEALRTGKINLYD